MIYDHDHYPRERKVLLSFPRDRSDMFGGKRVDRVRDAQRIREIQDLVRTIAGNVDDNGREMAQVRAMMKARAPSPPSRAERPTPVAPPRTSEPEPPMKVPEPMPPREGREAPVTPLRVPETEKPRMAPPPATPMPPPARERPVYCIHCGSRLPLDGSGCQVCASRNTRICPNCGMRVSASSVACPVCHRVMSPVVPYRRH